MWSPAFDSNKKEAFISYQAQVNKFGRRQHGFEKVLTGEQLDVDVMADGVNMWGVEPRPGYELVQKSTKAWNFFSSSLKNERDVDTLNRSKLPGAA